MGIPYCFKCDNGTGGCICNKKANMTKLEYEYAKGRLAGLREASYLTESPQTIISRANSVETQLSGITVHDEVAELKAQLAKAIVPKYQVGQEVYLITRKSSATVRPAIVQRLIFDSSKDLTIAYILRVGEFDYCYKDIEMFATEAEALKSLEEK